jgi:UDP-N-acetyl-D-glucosamine dehydrogenase
MYYNQLLGRLTDRTATIGIIGLGYVGLPLAVAFAEKGYTVIGLDVSQPKVDHLNRGESYIIDIPSEQVQAVVQAGKLRATTRYADLEKADVVSICVPTPLTRHKDPDMTYVEAAAKGVAAIAHPGMLVVLESTTYPGTTDEEIIPRLTERKFTIGEDIFVAFSPERIDPANKEWTVTNTPKVVGGKTAHCQHLALAYYGAIVEKVVGVSSPAVAEMTKLLENTYRAVNIGFINEMAIMCERLGIDVWEVIEAAKTKPFGFTAFYPGPGLGGHCIPLDPLYLSWRMRGLGYTAKFIEIADSVNTGMPDHVVTMVMEALNEDGKTLRNAKVAVLGVAYKRDVDDMRESPAMHVIAGLVKRGAQVTYNDPHVAEFKDEHTGLEMTGVAITEDWLKAADCVVIVTDHTAYDYPWIVEHSHLIVDTRNALKGVTLNGHGARVIKI